MSGASITTGEVGLAGIAATLAAALGATVLANLHARSLAENERSEGRKDWLRDRRIEVYATVVRAADEVAQYSEDLSRVRSASDLMTDEESAKYDTLFRAFWQAMADLQIVGPLSLAEAAGGWFDAAMTSKEDFSADAMYSARAKFVLGAKKALGIPLGE